MIEILAACIHGVLLSLGLIIPLGVQNIFIFNQGSVQPSIKQALPSVITASICDAALIILAILGISLLIMEIIWLKNVILAAGFLFLMYMGRATWRQHAAPLKTKQSPLSAKKQILFAMSVSILNPHAIIDTVVVIGSSAVAYSGPTKLAFTISCIAISCMWFLGLSFAGHSLHKIDKNGFWLKSINKIAAIMIWSIALYIGEQLLRSLGFSII